MTAILSTSSHAQQYPFENFTTENGLPEIHILSLFQNDDGVLWIGSNNGGIALYNGASFEYLTDKNGLPDNIVFDINKNEKGEILIGTNNGLSVYDGENFRNYNTENGLGHNQIKKIFIDKNKKIWIGTAKGVYLMSDSTFILFDVDSLLNQSPIFNIYQDSKNNYWFCTSGNGLLKYDGKNIAHYDSQNGLGHQYVYGFGEVAHDQYWILTHNGVYELSDTSIKKISLGPLGLKDVPCYSMIKDINNHIWVSTREGILKQMGPTFEFFNIHNGLVHNDIWKLFTDRENNLWFASKSGGLSKLSSQRFKFFTAKEGLASDKVTAVFQTLSGDYWVGTATGLNHLQEDTFYTYREDAGLSSNYINTIAEDREGNLWIGTGLGINKFNGKNFKQYFYEGNDNMNRCYHILIDKNGEPWFATKGGVLKLRNDKLVYVSENVINVEVFKILQDKDDFFWFATENGLYNFDGNQFKHFKQNDGITEKRIRSIVQDSSGALLFATASGFYRYLNGKFNNYTTENGLLSNNIISLAIDKKGNLWAGTSIGLDKIVMEGAKLMRVRHYEQADGFIGQDCFLNAILVDAHGSLWVGSLKGLTIYQSEYDKENDLEPQTRISGIFLNAQPTNWKNFADSVSSGNIPYKLSLSYEKKYLSFQFIGTSLTSPSKVRYQYMLKGLDKDWLPVTDKREAIYTDIPPGEYEFLVKAENGEGVWNQNPVSFSFKINPPFWKTWWFYSLCIIIFLSGVYSYIKIRTANIKIKAANKEILEQKNIIEEKNIELENANVEIAKKNKDITDSINYAKRIQEAILPPDKLVKEYIQNAFILYKPKDIVSGDFYWMGHKEDKVLFAVGDCTGHGVPGALMSIVGHNGLNAALKEHQLSLPGEILDQLNKEVEDTFSQNDYEIKDGMDIAICCIDYKKELLHFSGAYNPMYLVRKKEFPLEEQHSGIIKPSISAGQFALYEIKGDRQPIGAFENKVNFNTQTFKFEKDDAIYLFSDGYADQFGGPQKKKFMYNQLKNLILLLQSQNMEAQKHALYKNFEKWRGDNEQIDDVCVIGVRI
jgi:ligand-binding sensor domain-containing protein/serine phosphatase RsbU (regulator of sigma subunit)